MNIGKQKRLNRIIRPESGRTVIVPLDHGMTIGSVEGIDNIEETVKDMAKGKADAVLMHKGLVRHCNVEDLSQSSLIVHLSASTVISPQVNTKKLVANVEEAVKLGADAVSIHVNLGSENEGDMLEDAGKVAEQCEIWGMPLLMMMYARGRHIANQYDPQLIAHCARVADEIGADLVKVGYTGDIESFSKVVDSCHIPVIIAGGEKMDSLEDILTMIDNSLKAGGRGVSIGRNVFQCKERIALCKAMELLVHKKVNLKEALEALK